MQQIFILIKNIILNAKKIGENACFCLIELILYSYEIRSCFVQSSFSKQATACVCSGVEVEGCARRQRFAELYNGLTFTKI